MLPADKGFYPIHAAAGQRHDRLEVQGELVLRTAPLRISPSSAAAPGHIGRVPAGTW